MVIGTAEEAETVGQNLQRPFAVHQSVEFHPLLENPEDQILLLDAGVFGEVFPAGFLDQLGHRHPLQFDDVRIARLLDLLVLGVDVFLVGIHLGGDFLGQRKRIVLVVEMIVVVVFRPCRKRADLARSSGSMTW